MSDIVTNAEVEDVLSSIRRLVGDNKRPAEMADTKLDTGRFVLTPQLRVSEQDVLLLQPEDEVVPTEDWYEFEEPPLPETVSSGVEGAQIYDGDMYDATSDETGEIEDSATEAPEQVQEQATQEHDAGDEPDGEPTSQTSGISKTQQDFFALSAKIAALETAIAKTADQWEPDGDARDEYAGTRSPTMTWQEDVELDATGSPLHTGSTDTPEQEAPERGALQSLEETLDEQIIDEDMLRELVADIVRSELQGDLGERITRNVRKLVRREIHRALAAHSLD